MRPRIVVLGRTRAPSAREEDYVLSLRSAGHLARYVFIPTGYAGDRESCEQAHSYHADLLTGYKDVTVIPRGTGAMQVSDDQFTLPYGYYIEKSGPYYRLYRKDGTMVGNKALHKRLMLRLTQEVRDGIVD